MSIPSVPGITHADSKNFFLIAGPCVVESEKLIIDTSREIAELCSRLQIPFIFKSSYKKANRSKASSFSGLGDRNALRILKAVGEKWAIPVLTDIHSPDEAAMAAEFVDVLQIPAFLCRQTELLRAAGETGKWVNIKKGQFLAPDQMKYAAEKVSATGNQNILLTERGTTFGYHDLVVDFRSIPEMQQTGFPVVVDCTHSLQIPNSQQGITGGTPQYIETIALASIAAGADGIFIETHPHPAHALSDGANMLPLHQLEALLEKLIRIRKALVD